MKDTTEPFRRAFVAAQKALGPMDREACERHWGQTWDSDELREAFTVEGFLAPYVVVRRKADGQKGSLLFQHHPRFYYNWVPDKP